MQFIENIDIKLELDYDCMNKIHINTIKLIIKHDTIFGFLLLSSLKKNIFPGLRYTQYDILVPILFLHLSEHIPLPCVSKKNYTLLKWLPNEKYLILGRMIYMYG